ncbi:ThiF family adenylyltransferase [Desulfobotulus sp. H1]|uniref:ThiF family adenylyltransferase n=1 Tax=Desulfobotulus pelophilus TaxID=2823377 RepID=A0ABT3N843_9BACT|nr:ThiF family adenylyltransferase [Desulfobotulus pelophilus]MCW7753619.1 ThiF family adenylyltransferase [Desulfobotulus pelophilus]
MKDWILGQAEEGILSMASQRTLERNGALSSARAESLVLEAGVMPERYARNPWSVEEQNRIRKSCCAIVGCGALGSALLEQLLRIGVGTVKIMDPDVFGPSNLNRQILLTEACLGEPKVAVAAARARCVNPAVSLIPVQARFAKETAADFLDGVDLVLDALDTVEDRLVLEKECCRKGLVLIHGAVSGWAGQVAVCHAGEGRLERIYGNVQKGHGGIPAGNPVFGVFATAALQISLACRMLLYGSEEVRGHWFLDCMEPEWVWMDAESGKKAGVCPAK